MGATLNKPVTTAVLESHANKNFRVGMAEMNGWRTNMEDAHVVHFSPSGDAYFGVLDGHGGSACSEWCAKRLHERLEANGIPANDAAAKKMILEIDQAFLDTGQASGSTAAMCSVRPPAKPGEKFKLHVINAGDSRVLLCRANGAIIDGGGTDSGLTTDHKPDHPSERARIYRCGGTVEEAAGGVARVNGDLAVSRGFGDAEYKKTGGPGLENRPVTADPEMGHFEADAGDILLVVCDGVSEGDFSNPQVCKKAVEVLAETGGDATKASEAICHMAIETGSKDNISCMIVILGGAGGSASATTKTVGLTPGSLLGTNNASYVKAYTAMCERGGVTFAKAAEMRHALLVGRKGTPSAEEEDEEELKLIGSPPAGAAEKAAWFADWAQKCQEKKDERRGGGGAAGPMGDDGDDDGGMDQLMMMRVLMGMMQQQRQGGKGGGDP